MSDGVGVGPVIESGGQSDGSARSGQGDAESEEPQSRTTAGASGVALASGGAATAGLGEPRDAGVEHSEDGAAMGDGRQS
ncbi:hypothetical protein BH20CHL6_BH20CHL6_10910 [soil metagenome]